MTHLIEWPFFVMTFGGMAIHLLSTFLILILLGCHKICRTFQKCRKIDTADSKKGIYTAITETELQKAISEKSIWNNQLTATHEHGLVPESFIE